MPPKPPITFVGLGAMGNGMALHLLKSGYPVTGYDIFPPSLEKLQAQGGKAATNPREAAQCSEFFICMVATSAQATPLLFDDKTGAVKGLPQNATIMMCSTVAPAYIHEVVKRLQDMDRVDVRVIDCPVSGGAGRAADGTLSIFSSGNEKHLSHVHPILECLSSRLYQIPSGLGGGSKAKLIHQIFAGVNIAMSSEAMGLAAAAGLNTRDAYEELRKSDAGSWMFENRVPPMFDANHAPYSAMTIIAKDVGIITSTSRAEKFPLPLLATSEQLYTTAISAGWGKEDDCVLVRLYLPGRNDLVAQQTQASNNAKEPIVTVDDIKDLMVGVHLAAMSEAMSFCEHLGIDTNLMFDIVDNAAGATVVFTKTFKEMQKGRWSLKPAPEVEKVRDGLARAVQKAFELRYPVFLASAALQEFDRQLR